MSTTFWILILLFDLAAAYLIANYQKANGFTFSKSFIGALIGMLGLSLLGVKGWLSI